MHIMNISHTPHIFGSEQGSAGHSAYLSVQQQPGSHLHLLHPTHWSEFGHTKHEGHMRVSSLPFVPKQKHRTNSRTWCLSDPLATLQACFSWGWIISGSASCCCCLKSVQWPTLGCRSTSVLLFQCWRSTKDHGNQVIFCIFCIFCIFFMTFSFCL